MTLYKVTCYIEKEDNEDEKEFKQWVECNMLDKDVPELNSMEFRPLYDYEVQNFRVGVA